MGTRNCVFGVSAILHGCTGLIQRHLIRSEGKRVDYPTARDLAEQSLCYLFQLVGVLRG